MNQEDTIDDTVLEKTLVGIESLKNIMQLSIIVNNLTGDIAEVGVYKGGSALLLCRLNPTTDVYIFDTFGGLPEISSFDDTHKKDDFNDVCEQEVRDLLREHRNCNIYKGVFPRDIGIAIKDNWFKLVHLDVDIYTSYRDALSFFYPRMTHGGVIILDDYGSKFCHGAKKAVDEFMIDKPEKLIIGPERQAHFYKK